MDDFNGVKTKGPNFWLLYGSHTTLQVWMISAESRPRVQISDSWMVFIQHCKFEWFLQCQHQGSEFRTIYGFHTTLQVWMIKAELRPRVRISDSCMVFIQHCWSGWFQRSQDQGSEFQTLGWFSNSTATLDDFCRVKTKGPNFGLLDGFHTTLQVWMIIAEPRPRVRISDSWMVFMKLCRFGWF